MNLCTVSNLGLRHAGTHSNATRKEGDGPTHSGFLGLVRTEIASALRFFFFPARSEAGGKFSSLCTLESKESLLQWNLIS